MSHLVVGLRTEVVSTEPGVWCRRCLLSSGVVAHLAVTMVCPGVIPETMNLHQVGRCLECGLGDELDA